MQNMSRRLIWCVMLVGLLLRVAPTSAETGASAWLRYERIVDPAVRARYDAVTGPVVAMDDSAVVRTARDEFVRGVASMLGRQLPVATTADEPHVVFGTVDQIRRVLPAVMIPDLRDANAFWLFTIGPTIVVAGRDDRGVLYGT